MLTLNAQEIECLTFHACNATPISLSLISDPICYSASTPVIKFGTACSHNMSGVAHHLKNEAIPTENIYVKGFNESSSQVTQVGLSADSKSEQLYIPTMPSNLVLHCAADYTQSGATILFPTDGYVLSLTAAEQEYLRTYATTKPQIKQLLVQNNTYEVVNQDSTMSATGLEAYNSTATKYFNSKNNVSSTQERTLASLLTGLTFRDLLSMDNQLIKQCYENARHLIMLNLQLS